MRLIIGVENTFHCSELKKYKQLDVRDYVNLSHILADILTKEHCLPAEVTSSIPRLLLHRELIALERVNLRKSLAPAISFLRELTFDGRYIYITPVPEHEYLSLSICHMRIVLDLQRFDYAEKHTKVANSIGISRNTFLSYIQGYLFSLLKANIQPMNVSIPDIRETLCTSLIIPRITDYEAVACNGYMVNKTQVLSTIVDELSTLAYSLYNDLFLRIPLSFRNPNYQHTLEITPYGAFINVS